MGIFRFLYTLSNPALFKLLTRAICITFFFILSGSATAQELRLKREKAIGNRHPDFNKNSLIITTTGEIVTLTSSRYDTLNSDHGSYLVTKLDKNYNIIWQYHYVKPPDVRIANNIIETKDKGYLIIASHATLTSNHTRNIHLVKINVDGQLQWEAAFGGSGDDYGVDVQQASDGGYVLVANAFSTDGGIGNTTGKSQIWAAKISSSGGLIWGKLLTNNYNNTVFDLQKTKDGNFLLVGRAIDILTVSPNNGGGDGLMLKFTEDGTIVWQQYIGGNSGFDIFYKVTEDQSGNIYAAGTTRSTSNGFINYGLQDGWIVKLNASGSLIWNKQFGGSQTDAFQSIKVSKEGKISAGGNTLSNNGVVKDNYYHHSIWLMLFNEQTGAIENDYFGYVTDPGRNIEDIAIDQYGNVHFVAESDEGNVHMSNPKGQRDQWLVMMGRSNTVTGSVYLDLNSNGKRDIGETVSTGKIRIQKTNDQGNDVYHEIRNGDFSAEVDTGQYNITLRLDLAHYTALPENKLVNFASYFGRDSFDFRLIPIPGRNDLEIDIHPLNIPRPGFDVSYSLRYYNRGTTSIPDVVVKFVPDPRLTIKSSMPSGTILTTDTISWQVGNLDPMKWGEIILNGTIKPPPTVTRGDTIRQKAIILPVIQDTTPTNNSSLLSEIVQGSYDPNDKTEFHGGLLSVDALQNARLNYLIRFQNTGTDTAFNIIIRDTLHNSLDWTSIEMKAASHDYTMTLINNKLEWKFNEIKLPDSNRNEKASHGYIWYSIKPNTNLIPTNTITNSAGIYFDFNPPVQTNISSTTIANPILAKPSLTGLQDAYCRLSGAKKVRITNIPLASVATVTAKLDNIIVVVAGDSTLSFDPGTLSIGSHTILISFSSPLAVTNFSTQFIVTEPVVPEVRLSSNTTSVDNGTTDIVMSATSIKGAGSSPLFTFAKDRAFSNIAQAESSKNTLSILSQTLVTGENWFYVKMKTSELCYSSLTSIDSVKITRTAVTGLVDLDFPQTVITIFPNPFNDHVTVKGLQSSKNYIIDLLDASGKSVSSKKVINRRMIEFRSPGLSAGKYFLRIYDPKNQRLIGTIPVLHP